VLDALSTIATGSGKGAVNFIPDVVNGILTPMQSIVNDVLGTDYTAQVPTVPYANEWEQYSGQNAQSVIAVGVTFAGAGAFSGTAEGAAATPTSYVTLYRGDATAQSQFLSALARSQGVDASNAAIAQAEANGSISYLFEDHALNSGASPYIGLTTSPEVAESFARGLTGTQTGYVTQFQLPAGFAQPNFENLNAWEREYLAPTQINNNHIVNQYQVTPK
jgi:hypothetical protein